MELPTYFIFCLRSANAVLRSVQAGVRTIEEISMITRLPPEEVMDWNDLLNLKIGQRT